MKLHLPKTLLAAVLAAVVMAPATVLADSVSVNFYQNGASDEKISGTAAGGVLFGVDKSDWNDVTSDGIKTQTIALKTAEDQSLSMVLTTTVATATWGNGSASKNNLEQLLQSSYIDVNGNQTWTVALDTGDWWLKDVTFYMAGDGDSGTYSPINLNGVNYVGGVNNEGNGAWGDRKLNSGSYSEVEGYDGTTAIADVDLNADSAVRVTNVAGMVVATNTATSGGRATLAGMQVVDRTAEMVYTSTLGAAATLSDVEWSKQGVEGTTTLASIDSAARYLSVAADTEGSTLNIAGTTTISGLQLTANALTITGSTLTTGALHANNGTTLTMEAGIAGENLALSGQGDIVLNSVDYTGKITVASGTTVQLQTNTKGWGSFTNSGTVHVNAGSESVLNNLIGKNDGVYKPSYITNTAGGNLVVNLTGTKNLSGNITIANGGRVTLKGGTLGTSGSRITGQIKSENNTILCLEDTQVYIGSSNERIINLNVEVGSGATLDVSGGDAFKYDNTILTVKDGGIVNLGESRQSLGLSSKVVLAGGKINGTGDSTHGLSLDFYDGGTIETKSSSTLNAHVGSHDNEGTLTFDVASGATLTMTGSFKKGGQFAKGNAGTLLYKGAAFGSTLTIDGGVFDYNVSTEGTHSGSIMGAGQLKKSGSGTLNITGAVGSANAALGSLAVSEGSLKLSNTSYISNIDMYSGASLVFSGQGKTHTISGLVQTKDSTSGSLTVESGTTVVMGGLKNSWGMNGGIVVDGTLSFKEQGVLELSYNAAPQSVTGSGSISASKLVFGNSGTYNIAVDILTIGAGGLDMQSAWWGGTTTANLTSRIVDVTGATTLNGSSVLNINGGTVTLKGGISSQGVVSMTGGSLSLGAGTTNSIATFNYSGGTLSYERLTLNDVTISGPSLNNTGVLDLNGVLNVTSIDELTPHGEMSYIGGQQEGNGFVNGGSYYIVQGGSINYGESFVVQFEGTALGFEAGSGNYATKDTSEGNNALIITLAGTSEYFYVNSGVETVAQSSSYSYYVRENGKLVVDGEVTGVLTKSITGTGTVAVTIGTNADGSYGNGFAARDFNGVLEIAKAATGKGNINLIDNCTLGADATLRLISGNHWSDGGVISRALELAGDESNHFVFTHVNTLELSGKVTGTYLTAGQSYDRYFQTGGNNAADNNLILSGAGSNIQHVKMNGGNLTVSADMAFGTINAPTLTVAEGVTLTIGTGQETQSQISSSLSAAGAALVLADGTTLSLAGGTEGSQKIHTLGSMTQGAGSVLSLGDYSTLQLYMPAETAFAANTSISDPILNLTLAGGTGTVLEFAMDSHFEHTYNNTVKLTAANGATKPVETVRIASGFLANTVHTGSAATNLGGADLIMADGANLVVRTGGKEVDFGAGAITLEGTSDLYLYGSVHNYDTTITNDISGDTLRFKDEGEVTLTGNINLTALVNDGSSDDEIKFTGASVHADTVTLASNKTITLGDGDDAVLSKVSFDTVNVANNANATIKLNSDASLTSNGKTGGTLKLDGSGVYELNLSDTSDISGISVNESWTGTVKVSGGDINQLNNYANANSTLELTGVKAWISNNQTLKGTLKLTNGAVSALTLNDGYSSACVATFAATIEGFGDIRQYWHSSTADPDLQITFSGNTDGWSGKFISDANNSGKNVVLNFTKAGNVFSSTTDGGGIVNESSKKLTVNIGNEEGDINFNGTISRTGTGNVEVAVTNNTVSFSKAVSVDTFAVANEANAKLAAGGSITAGNVSFSKQNATLNNVTVSGSSITKTGGSAGSIAGADISLAELAAGSSFSISDMALSNVTVSAATAGTAVNLTNITASAVQLAQGSFTMTNTAEVGSHSVDGSTASFTTDLLSGITLNNTDSSATLTVDLGDLAAVAALEEGKTYDLSITLNGFTMMNYEVGTGLVFAADSWLGQLLAEHGYVSGSLEAPEALASTSPVKVTYTGIAGEGGVNVGTIVTITGLTIPEPTTTTLSLLALCGLAARRRRK